MHHHEHFHALATRLPDCGLFLASSLYYACDVANIETGHDTSTSMLILPTEDYEGPSRKPQLTCC
jgi:hypothetical protein